MKYLLTLLLLLGLSAPAGAFEYRYPRSSVEMKLQQVSPHVWFVQGKTGIATDNQGFISNATVIIGKQGITVVDALGSPSLAEQLLAQIRQISDLPIERVITTHYHADHIYGLQAFKERGARILAPSGIDDYLNSPQAAERLEERRFSLLDDGQVRLTLNYLGKAHSDADLTVFVEPDDVLISGDVIFEGRVPFVGDSDSRAWLETLERMARKQGIRALIPGHGGLARKPKQAIELTRDYLAYLREQLGAGVEEMCPPFPRPIASMPIPCSWPWSGSPWNRSPQKLGGSFRSSVLSGRSGRVSSPWARLSIHTSSS